MSKVLSELKSKELIELVNPEARKGRLYRLTDKGEIVCKNIKNYMKDNKKASLLIITHYPRILEYLKPDYVHILKDGKIRKSGDISLALEIEKEGYTSIEDKNNE